MAERGTEKGFGPLVPDACRALILGTYPSPKSFEAQFFYGHPQNRFWPLVAALAGVEAPRTVAEKRALILDGRAALWDTLESCRITGASDASIRDPVPNNVAALVTEKGITHVFCNGAASHRLYEKFHRPATGIAALRLPSTSPANAAFSFERLLEAWQPVAEFLSPPGD
ncbi:DNA-deoxyinosine glycosylase [Ruminococcaceae bacterium OttesenSCG-928-D13]|nr:DNA-deoxyinosine glycosylase [Ruminococcaceae bacterium OttesenSCG-928-D13]